MVTIPKFEDGQFLSETELYQLAWIPFHLYRLSSRGLGQEGFLSPDVTGELLWNFFDHSAGKLTIDRLFVLSPEGIPFISTTVIELDLSAVTVDSTTLFASAYFAESSEAFRDESGATLSVRPQADQAHPWNQSHEPNAYMLALHWGRDDAPVVAGTKHFQLELGTLGGASGESFRPSPRAHFPSGLPVLARELRRFRATVDAYVAMLLDPVNAPGVERTTLLDRLEMLQAELAGTGSPTVRIIDSARLVLRAAQGFYLRVAYQQNPDEPQYVGCRELEGRLLEHQLERSYVGRRDPLGSLLADIERFAALDPRTGHEQVDYFRLMGELFEADRQTDLFASLAEPTRRREPAPRAPERSQQRQNGPRIIPLDKRDD